MCYSFNDSTCKNQTKKKEMEKQQFLLQHQRIIHVILNLAYNKSF